VLRATSGHAFEVVHVQGIHTLVAPLAMLGAAIGRTPFIVTFHTGGHRSSVRRRLRGVQWFLLGPLLRRAAALVGVSEFERSLIAEAAGIDPARIRVIRNGGGLPAAAAAEGVEDPDLVLSVGRLERYKGHHRAVAAMPDLLRLRPGASLAIIGDGPEREALERQAASLGIGDRVSIRAVPGGDRDEMARVMAAAGLVVLLSGYEAHPVAVTEARALGRRVLVADTTGLSEVAAAGEATAIPIDASSAELAAAMDAAMSAPPPLSADQPTWEDCATQLLELYRTVAAEHATDRRAMRAPRAPSR
jgi:glycosyltransferase involved in cell wall biosynthesis